MPKAVKAVTRKTMSRLGKAALVAGTTTALAVGFAGSAFAAAPGPLPWQASAYQDKYQPYFDYDHDGGSGRSSRNGRSPAP